MDSIHKRGVVKEISNTMVIGLASVLIAIPAMANSEKESAQCRVVGQKAFKVMLSYQSYEMVSM